MRKVAVIGIGRVGLPLALVLAEVGYEVVGIDRQQDHVDLVNRHMAPFHEEQLEEYLAKYVGKGFRASTDLSSVASCDVIVITVGTPVDENLNPVLNDLYRVVDGLGPLLTKGQTLILRSTVSPHTTEHVAKRLELATGLLIGKDLFLAFCPERIAEGKAFSELRNIPQIIGGTDEQSTIRARGFFSPLGVPIEECDPLSAEVAKLYSNMYRYVTFAIANEFMMLAEGFGLHYEEVRQLVNNGYKRGGLPSAGLAAGPCLYKDGFFLLDQVPYSELITTSWRINESIPNYIVHQVSGHVSLDGIRVGLLGMAFKADSDDTRQSLSFRLKKTFMARGAEVSLHDPLVPGFGGSVEDVVDKSEVVVIAVPHRYYRENLPRILSGRSVLVSDLWNVCRTGKSVFLSHELSADLTGQLL